MARELKPFVFQPPGPQNLAQKTPLRPSASSQLVLLPWLADDEAARCHLWARWLNGFGLGLSHFEVTI